MKIIKYTMEDENESYGGTEAMRRQISPESFSQNRSYFGKKFQNYRDALQYYKLCTGTRNPTILENSAIVYSDGSFYPWSNAGGYGIHITLADGSVNRIYGRVPQQLSIGSKYAEMYAVFVVLSIYPDVNMVIFTDAQSVINDLMCTSPTDNEYMELFIRIKELMANRSIELFFVKGHSGNYRNEEADRLAALGVKSDDNIVISYNGGEFKRVAKHKSIEKLEGDFALKEQRLQELRYQALENERLEREENKISRAWIETDRRNNGMFFGGNLILPTLEKVRIYGLAPATYDYESTRLYAIYVILSINRNDIIIHTKQKEVELLTLDLANIRSNEYKVKNGKIIAAIDKLMQDRNVIITSINKDSEKAYEKAAKALADVASAIVNSNNNLIVYRGDIRIR